MTTKKGSVVLLLQIYSHKYTAGHIFQRFLPIKKKKKMSKLMFTKYCEWLNFLPIFICFFLLAHNAELCKNIYLQ